MTFRQVHTTPDIFEIQVPFSNVSFASTNCYVVRDGDESIIIDTGAPSEEGAAVLFDALDVLGVNLERTTLFLTHLHLDHAGQAERILSRGALLCASAVDADFLRPEQALVASRKILSRMLAEGAGEQEARACARMFEQVDYFDPFKRRHRLVKENDILSVGRYDFRVVETPGHTPGHLALYSPEHKLIFSGDHMLYIISPSIEPSLVGLSSLQCYLNSLDKLRNLPLEKLFCAHGALRNDFANRIEWLARHHEDRLLETLSIIEANPGLSGYPLIRSIHWNVPFDAWEDISSLQRGCILLEGIALLDHLVIAGRVEQLSSAEGQNHYRVVEG